MVDNLWPLPDGWEWKKISDIATTTSGGTPSRKNSEYFTGHINWFKSGELGDSEIFNSEEKITEEAIKKSSAKIFPKDTLLIAMYGATVGKLGILGIDAATNQAVCAIFPKKNLGIKIVEEKFLFYFFKFIRSQLIERSFGGAQPNISQTIINNVTIPIPYPNNPKLSLDIQQRIVARIESLLGEIKHNRSLLEQMRQDTEQLLDSAIKECFALSRMETWKNHSCLGEIAKIIAKQVDPTLPQYQTLPHIGVDVIQANTCQLEDYRTIEEDGVTSGKYLFTSGSILYSKIRPYLRKSVLVDFEGLCSADIYPLSVISDEIEPKFLMWFLISPLFTDYAKSHSGRARIPKINRDALFSFKLVYPNYEEQISIISYLDLIRFEVQKIDKLLKEDEKNFNYLEQAILEKAFRGEL
ncbi:restriction endonuclease subunit S [Gloeothece citriformis]|nr:restriction endonuclease subunit S [Gloeothece citriformis]